MTPEMVESQKPAGPEPTARGPYLSAVRDAWRNACLLHDPRSPALDFALRAFARDGRARGASVGSLLRALDALVRPANGGDLELDVPSLREWAGTQVIRSFYRDD
jgi:hypothetical protein